MAPDLDVRGQCQRLAWLVLEPRIYSRETPTHKRDPESKGSPRKARALFSFPVLGIGRLAAVPGRALSVPVSFLISTAWLLARLWYPTAVRARLGVHSETAPAQIPAGWVPLQSRAHREPLAPPAAASGSTRSAPPTPRTPRWKREGAARGLGYAVVQCSQMGLWASALGEQALSGEPTLRAGALSGSMPDPDYYSLTLCLSYTQEKAEGIHPDPSAPGPHDPTPGKASELPDILVSRSWAGDWMLQLLRLCT